MKLYETYIEMQNNLYRVVCNLWYKLSQEDSMIKSKTKIKNNKITLETDFFCEKCICKLVHNFPIL